MGAITNFRLGIDANVSGEEQIKALQDRMNEFASQLDNHKKTAAAFPEGFAGWSDKIKEAISNPLQAAGGAIGTVLDRIGPLGTKLAATAGVLAGAGIVAFEFAHQMGELAVSINNTSLRMGLSTKEVGQFTFAAKLAGSDIGTLEGAMRKLSLGLADSTADGEKARLGLAKLGVSARDASGELRPTNDVFLDISKGLAGIGNAAERNAAAVKIFGRAGIELIPVLMGLAENVERAKQLDLGLDEKTVKELEDAHKELAGISAAWEKLARAPKIILTVEIAKLFKWIRGDEDDKGPMTPQEKDVERRRREYDASPQSKIDDIKSSLRMYEGGGDPLSVARTATLRRQLADQQELLSGDGKRILDRALGGGAVGQHDLTKQLDAARKNLESIEGEARGLQQNKDGVLTEPAQAMAARVAEARKEVEVIEAKVKALHGVEENTRKVAAALVELHHAATVGESPFLKTTAGWVEKLSQLKLSPAESKDAYGTLNRIMIEEEATERTKLSKEWEKIEMAAYKHLAEEWKKDWEEVYKPMEEQGKRRADAAIELGKEGVNYRYGGELTDAQRSAKLASGLFGATSQLPGAGIDFNYASQVDLASKKYDIEHRRLEEMIRYEPVETQALKLQTDTLKLKADMEKSMDDARMEREVAYAQLQQKHLDDLKLKSEDLARGMFAAFSGGGSGMQQWLKGLGMSTAETIFTNATAPIFKEILGSLGGAGKASGLGGLLSGTLFDPKNAPLDANTVALNTLTAALTGKALAGADLSVTGGTGGLVGAFKRLAGLDTSSTSGESGGAWVGNGATYGTDEYGNPTFGNPTYQEESQGYALGAPTSFSSNTGKAVSAGMTVAGGALMAYNGFSRGGAQGGLEGAAGIMTAASAIPGPQQPFIMAAAMTLGMISAMLGDPKQMRETAIGREIRDALYMAPPSVSVQSDITGARTRTNRAGQIDSTPWDAFRYQVNDPYYIRGPHNSSNLEQVPGTVIYLTIPINAMDAKSVIDQRNNIAAAVHQAMQEGHPLNYQVQTAAGH
jgi:hypothetical protein